MRRKIKNNIKKVIFEDKNIRLLQVSFKYKNKKKEDICYSFVDIINFKI